MIVPQEKTMKRVKKCKSLKIHIVDLYRSAKQPGNAK